MVKAMLECQYQLMDRLAHQEQKTIIAQPVNTEENKLVAVPGNLPVRKEEPASVIMPLTYEKLKTLTVYFAESIENHYMRTKGIHSHINLLHTLYHLGGEAFTEELISCAGIEEPSAFRYLSYLRKIRLVTFRGYRPRGGYQLTPAGRKFIEGEIKNREQMKAALAEQKY
jgi:hypothetical protein